MTKQPAEDDFGEWLAGEMQSKLSIDDPVMCEYLTGIVTLDASSTDEKREGVIEFLGELTERALDEFADAVLARWNEIDSARKKAEQQRALEERQKAQALVRAKEEAERQTQATAEPKKEMTVEERKRREALLKQYAYDLEDEIYRAPVDENEDGEIEIQFKDRSSQQDALAGLQANNNAAYVAELELQKRMKAKAEHEKKVKMDKEQQEREKAKKEKEKRRTQKQEHRRM